jgi:hypothetical protein
MPTESATTPETVQSRPVRMWVRALAWVIVVAGMLPLGWMIYYVLARGV